MQISLLKNRILVLYYAMLADWKQYGASILIDYNIYPFKNRKYPYYHKCIIHYHIKDSRNIPPYSQNGRM